MSDDPPEETHQESWDKRYAESDQIWSGRPNATLVNNVDGMAPGRALDLGCGEGADAIWLAQQGWTVTGVDISALAVERATAHAEQAGVADRVEIAHHDLAHSFPTGRFDLVSAQYFHSQRDFPRDQILRTAAASIDPGGTLLIVGHADFPPWAEHRHEDVQFPTAPEVLETLELDPSNWTVERCEQVEREATGPGGHSGALIDSIVRARRSA